MMMDGVGWGGVGLESEDKLMPNCALCMTVLGRAGKGRTVGCQKCLTWEYTVCILSDKGLYVAGVGNDRHLVLLLLNVLAKHLFCHSNK
jgi:hypothetical protein